MQSVQLRSGTERAMERAKRISREIDMLIRSAPEVFNALGDNACGRSDCDAYVKALYTAGRSIRDFMSVAERAIIEGSRENS